MIPLISIIKDPVGGWLALAFILIFVIKAVLALFGADTDADGDIDFGEDAGGVDVNADGFGFSASDIFSLKGFINFGVGFCSYWALFGLSGGNAVGAVIVGIVTFVLLLYAYRACMKLEGNTVLEKPEDLKNRPGTVYIKNDTNLVIQLEVNGRIDELTVLPDDSTNINDYKVGQVIYISDVRLNGEFPCFFVKPYNNN